jgi:hypothetical protein
MSPERCAQRAERPALCWPQPGLGLDHPQKLRRAQTHAHTPRTPQFQSIFRHSARPHAAQNAVIKRALLGTHAQRTPLFFSPIGRARPACPPP